MPPKCRKANLVTNWIYSTNVGTVVIGAIISLGLLDIRNRLGEIRDTIKNKNSSQLIDTLDTKLKELDSKLASGEIKKEDYEKERRKIIEEVIGSH